MYIKIVQNHYDLPNQDGYYLLKLNNNIFENNYKFFDSSEVIPVKEFHMCCDKSREITKNGIIKYFKNPFVIYDDYKQNIRLYNERFTKCIPIIGELKDNIMRDIITGTIYEYNPNNEIIDIPSYSKCIKIPSMIVKSVLENITLQDANNYANCIISLRNTIKNNSKEQKKVK